MKVISRLLTSIDLFSPSPHLLVNGRKKLKNSIGGATTFMIALAFFIMFVILASKIFNREEPNVVYSVKYKETSNFTLLKDVVISTGLVAGDGSSIEESERVYEVHMFYELMESKLVDGNMIINPIVTELNVTKCSLEHFGEKKEIFEKSRYVDYYCIDPNRTNTEITILNPYANPDKTYSDIYIAITRCTNGTSSGKICKTNEEIDKALNSYYWEFGISDFYVDHDNFDSPAVPYARKVIFFSSISLYKSIEIFFRDFSYTDDIGLVFQESSSHTKTTLDYTTNTVSLESMGLYLPNQIADAYISYNPSGFHDFYQRRYKKLQDVVVSVGGILQVFQILSQVIVFFVSNRIFYNYLMNNNFKLFNLDKISSSFNLSGAFGAMNKNSASITTAKYLNQNNNFLKPSESENRTENRNKEEILTILEDSKKTISAKYSRAYHIFGCVKKVKNKRVFDNIMKICDERLEIKNIVKSQIEMEFLKPLFLTDSINYKKFNLLIPFEHYFYEKGEVGKNQIGLNKNSNICYTLESRIDALTELVNKIS